MSTPEPIIDVNPIDQSRAAEAPSSTPVGAAARAAGANAGSNSQRYYTFVDAEHGDVRPSGGASAGQPRSSAPGTAGGAPTYVQAEVIGGQGSHGAPGASAKGGTRVGGIAQMAVGGAVAVVGVPMLILPGPGLLAIAGGLVLVATGAKKAFGKKGRPGA